MFTTKGSKSSCCKNHIAIAHFDGKTEAEGKKQINYFLTAPFKRVLSMFYLRFKQTRRIYHDGEKTSAESFGLEQEVKGGGG